MNNRFQAYELGYETPVDSGLQNELEIVDANIRDQYKLAASQTAVGLFDALTLRLAMLRPDCEFYGASVPKIGILLAYLQLRPAESQTMDSTTQHELGLMIKASSNELAAKYSRQLGLKQIQQVLASHHFYDVQRGGGIWIGKHYGDDSERIGSPVADNSHGATVRQLLRFYLLLEQGRLVSPASSAKMREIFASPEIPHDDSKFIKTLSQRNVAILRKSGSWEEWLHDTAIVTGPGRRYILIALTHHPRGDEYLAALAEAVDDLMTATTLGKHGHAPKVSSPRSSA
jgi:beta-lactamase class A